MKSLILPGLLLASLAVTAGGQETQQPTPDPAAEELNPIAELQASDDPFERAVGQVHGDLEASLAELAALREQVKNERLPLSQQLSDLESQLSAARQEYTDTVRLLDKRNLDVDTLRNEIDHLKGDADYISNLLAEYVRNFDSRLHITEVARYHDPLEAAKLAVENTTLSERDVFEVQAKLLDVALARVEDGLGGTRFEGWAVDTRGLLQQGSMVLVGPAAIFVSNNGRVVGAAESRLGSLEPAAIPFGKPEDAAAATDLAANGGGFFPLDPTLGNAYLVEGTQETLMEHLENGGPVMIPILVLAGLALLVVLYKLLAILFTPKPSMRKIGPLLDAVGRQDEAKIHEQARKIRGPIGRMLTAGVEHLREPQELIEEVMYEAVLTTKLKLQSLLPFVAICAASAPLLGLLGTVTGIINTFKLITVFGSGDVKSLSGGISEALITTKFGLIVAIPSLLLHAFLSRQAKSITDRMEKAAVAFVNQVMRTRSADKSRNGAADVEYELPTGVARPDRELVREQVNEILQGLLGSDGPDRDKEELAELSKR